MFNNVVQLRYLQTFDHKDIEKGTYTQMMRFYHYFLFT